MRSLRRLSGLVRWVAGVAAVLVAVLVLGGSVGYGQQREPKQQTSGSGGLSPIAAQAFLEEEKGKAVERRARRASEEQRAKRRQSRERYRGLSRSEALAVGKRLLPRQLDRPGWKPLDLVPGQEVREYTGPFTARVSGGDGRPPTLVESTLPLRVADADGDLAPVDLKVVSRGGAFVPRNPLVGVRAGSHAADAVALPDVDVAVSLAGAQESARGQASGASVFYPNALPDSDLVIQPKPDGFESFVVLRSSSSPEVTRYRFALPAGATLRESSEEGFEIVRGEERLASVSEPRAWDADGVAVDTETNVVGNDELRISVPHQDLDLKYPLTVDPHISENFRNWQTGQTANFAGWSTWSPRANQGVYFANSNWFLGLGLYVFQRYGSEQPSWHYDYNWVPAEWQFRTRGTTWVYAAQSYLRANDNTATCQYEGIYSPGDDGWPAQTQWHYSDSGVFVGARYTDFLPTGSDAPWKDCNRWRQDRQIGSWLEDSRYFCLGFYSCESAPVRTSGNYYVLGTHVTPGRWYDFTTFMGGAAVHIADPEDPKIVNFSVPSDWTNDSAAGIAFSAQDPGLGVRSLRTYVPNVSWSGAKGGDPLCDGRALNPCSAGRSLSTTVGNLPEGEVQVVGEAVDPAGRLGRDQRTVKVDRTAPRVVTFSNGAVRPNALLRSGQHSLRIDAQDLGSGGIPNSGVKRIEYQLDNGTWRTATTNCESGPCQATWSLNAGPDGLSEGSHHLEARVWDGVGHVSAHQGFDFIVDRTPPVVDLAGPLVEQSGKRLSDGFWTMDATATDEATNRATAGVRNIRVMVDGSPLRLDGEDTGLADQDGDCSRTGCPLDYFDIAYYTREYAEGKRTISVQAEDYAGNRSVARTFTIENSNDVPEPERQAEASSPDFMVYHAGPSFEGLSVTGASRHHVATDPEFPELGRQDNVTYLYGECPTPINDEAAQVEGGCLPPIEIQSSPLCEKHKNLYQDPEVGVTPFKEKTIKGAPAASFSGGRILEIYTGNTTISIYGKDPAQVLRFADALRLALQEEIPTLAQPLTSLAAAGAATAALPVLPPPDANVLAQTEPCK